MLSRLKFWLVALALGTLPLAALAWLAPPTAAAGPAGTAPDAVDVQPLAASTKTVNHAHAVPGQQLRYTVRLSNSGLDAIDPVVMTDTLPVGLTYVGGTLSANAGTFGEAGGVITWTGTLTAGEVVVVEFYAATAPDAPLGTVITNTALISGASDTLAREAVTTLANAQIYLPIVARPQSGIRGRVTFNGLPAAGVFLELRHFNGSSYSTETSTVTDAGGYYFFSSAPALPPGHSYYVRFLNTSETPGQLWFWGTADITSFNPSSMVQAGNFDLADVTLLTPEPGDLVNLPAQFGWVKRVHSPTDSYQLTIFDPTGPLFAATNPLGYVNGVILTGLPGAFESYTEYGWSVDINSPDGGLGTAYFYNPIGFGNVLAGSAAEVAGGAEAWPATARTDKPRP